MVAGDTWIFFPHKHSMPWAGWVAPEWHCTIRWRCRLRCTRSFTPTMYYDRYVVRLLCERLFVSRTQDFRVHNLRKIGEKNDLLWYPWIRKIRFVRLSMRPKRFVVRKSDCESVCPWRVFPVPLLLCSLVVTILVYHGMCQSYEDYYILLLMEQKRQPRDHLVSPTKKKKKKWERERVVHKLSQNNIETIDIFDGRYR